MSVIKADLCPHCGHIMRTFTRKFNWGMAMTLMCMRRVTLLDKPPDGFMNLNQLKGCWGFNPAQSRENGSIRMWKLIEEKPNEKTGKRTSGYWRLTTLGFSFTGCTATIRQSIVVRNKTLLGYDGPMVSIDDCLRTTNRFDYSDLMQRMWDEGAR